MVLCQIFQATKRKRQEHCGTVKLCQMLNPARPPIRRMPRRFARGPPGINLSNQLRTELDNIDAVTDATCLSQGHRLLFRLEVWTRRFRRFKMCGQAWSGYRIFQKSINHINDQESSEESTSERGSQSRSCHRSSRVMSRV